MTGIKTRLSFKERLFLLFIFFIALSTRLFLIQNTPHSNQAIDLCIYRDEGQLITNGINPYDFNDKKEVRNKLRTDSIAYIAWTSETQERWDYYSSSNLPLSMLFHGLIESVSAGNPVVYRVVFSFFDSILAVVIGYFLIECWRLNLSFFNSILIIGLGALSPTLLLWGCSFSEDKGSQILLMLLAVLLARNQKLIWSALLLGASIAFKGLGFFIVPLCLFLIVNKDEPVLKLNKGQIKPAIMYLSLTFIFTIVWFLPYIPEIFTMMQRRLELNMGTSVIPEHGSIWTIVFKNFPTGWSHIKILVILLISLFWGYTFLIRKLQVPALSLFILVLFVDVMLLKGSLDRMNIGIIVSSVCFSFVDIKYARILGWYTIIAGFYLYPKTNILNGSIVETIDAIYVLGFLTIFCAYPIYFLLKAKSEYSDLKNI